MKAEYDVLDTKDYEGTITDAETFRMSEIYDMYMENQVLNDQFLAEEAAKQREI
jgi:hypothetical protein